MKKESRKNQGRIKEESRKNQGRSKKMRDLVVKKKEV
jgi:hypothetical protein